MKKNKIKLEKKRKVLKGIRKGLEEVVNAKKGGKQLQTLSDFLNEMKRKKS